MYVPSLVDRRNYLSLGTMCKVVNEPVYFPNDVFVPRITTFKITIYVALLSTFSSYYCIFYIPLYLKLVLLGVTYQFTLLMPNLYLY